MTKTFLVIACSALVGCGSAYISPSVEEVSEASAQSPKVVVVPLSAAVAQQANRSAYTPLDLPAIFSNVTTLPATRGAGALPEAVVDPERRPEAIEMRVPPALPETPYQIGVADVLLLATPSVGSTVEQLSGLLAAQSKRQGYTVQDDGAIAIPDVGRIELAGLTLEEAEAEIFQALVTNQINPTFSIEIAEFNSQRVSVGGAVGSPTLAPISLKPLYLEEALLLAGGVTAPDADYTTIRLYRDGTLYQIPLTQLYTKSDLKRIRLKDGDSVFVDTEFELGQAQAYFEEQITLINMRAAARSQALSELQNEFSIRQSQAEQARSNFTTKVSLDAVPREYVYLSGEVASQGRFALPFGQKAKLADALFSQNGISTREGNPSQIYVLRGNKAGDQVTAYQLDARNIANMLVATRMELRPNDIIFVAEQPVTKWNRAWSQINIAFFNSGVALATE